jgi:WD40 repeat protein
VSCGLDQTVRVWNLSTVEELTCLEGHEDRVHTALFSKDGFTVLSGSWDKTVRLWKSQLSDLCHKPLSQASAADLAWAQEMTWDTKLTNEEKLWLQFLIVLMKRRRQHDIQIAEPATIEVGEFDIEIVG